MTTGSAPEVSVVIPVCRARATIAQCLGALARQVDAPDFEVIVVVNGEDDGSADWVRAETPWAHLIVSPKRLFAGAARNLGADAARGEILAFLDADCAVGPDWVASIGAAHRLGLSALIGGVVENDADGGVLSWAYHFASFATWNLTSVDAPAVVSDLAGSCLTVRREVFERAGRFAPMRLNEDTELSWRLERCGHVPIVAPSIRVRHRCDPTLRDLVQRRLQSGIGFARLRTRFFRLGAMQRRARTLLMPLVPWVLLLRAGRRVWMVGESRREFLYAIPATLLACCAWSLGEAWGYLRADA